MFRYLVWTVAALALTSAGSAQEGGESPAPPPTPILPGEPLKITVVGEPSLSGVYSVDLAGRIELPLVGSVQVGGLTYFQARQAVTRALSEYLRHPQVSVQPAMPLRVAVAGAVLRPGYVEYTAGMTATQALAAVGGPAPGARLREAYVIRQALHLPARAERRRVNLKEVGTPRHPDLLLQPGDLLFIPQPRTRGRDHPLIRLLGLGGLLF